ncbi:MAG: 30S ribosomal protein S12 methylthiotransferase RimO [Clostridia bacterium]|nr:30S ribosomal protein S12 methylthiotransferase RimO [Clostridia bacterium]
MVPGNISVGMISLGCAKNRIDSEIMLGLLKEAGYRITGDENKADIVIINTCGFIESSKREAIDAILETAALKESGNVKGIIVAGCLAQRYGNDIVKSMPEVDAVMGAYGYSDICKAVESVIGNVIGQAAGSVPEGFAQSAARDIGAARNVGAAGNIGEARSSVDGRGEAPGEGPASGRTSAQNAAQGVCYFDDEVRLSLDYLDGERVLTTPGSYAYLKLAEGCSNRCSYCAIPSIKGPFRSRPLESVLAEAAALGKKGIKELVLVAQDSTMYGRDIAGRSLLPELLEGLDGIGGIKAVRILYLYPDELDDDIFAAMTRSRKLLRYFDIPMQHISTAVLKRMNRRGTKEMYLEALERFRREMPDCVIRTSLITGFPGETEEDHRELKDFLRTAAVQRAGVFTYSREEGTKAAGFKDQIHGNTKKRRYRELMEILRANSEEFNRSRVGKVYDVIVDGTAEDGIFYTGRSYMEAPEEDGLIYFAAKDELSPGDIVKVKILIAGEYDLTGEQVEEDED